MWEMFKLRLFLAWNGEISHFAILFGLVEIFEIIPQSSKHMSLKHFRWLLEN